MKTVLDILNEKQSTNYLPIIPMTVTDLDKAQKSVIYAIEKYNLVTVTGAAGTGKTTTIVNVASNFLAKGKKVLVVSKSDKAVDVVADRLNALGAKYLALRSGNKANKVFLAEKLSSLIANKVDLDIEGICLLEWFFKKDTKELLKRKRVSQLTSLLVNSDSRKRLIIHSKALLTNKRMAREKLLKEDFSPILEAFPCWCCTTMQLSESLPLEKGMFDLVIIDEASQCDIASCVPALYRAKKALVVGDEKQLKHMSWLEKSKEQSFLTKHKVPENLQLIWRYRSNSVFDFANYYAEKSILLNIQYRSPKNIVEFANREFYNGAIDSYKQAEKNALIKIAVNGSIDDKGVNSDEVKEVIRLVKSYLNQGKSIGILSPFRNQVNAIEKAIMENFTIDEIKNNGITVGTAHTYQGEEKDIMILSWCVAKNSPYQSWTFINNANLFNVAITRGKEKVVNLYSAEKESLLKKYLNYGTL